MSLADFLDLFVQTIFLLVALLTLVDLVRYRTRQRFDIAALFGSLATAILIGRITQLTGLEQPWLQTLAGIALVAHPYLLLSLVHYLRPTSWPARWAGLAGLVVFWAILILSPTVPSLLVIAFIAYFFIIEGYVTVVMIDRALATGGINRRRLSLAAAGSGLLAIVILLAVIIAILPFTSSLIRPVIQLVAVLIALSYYLGFAPPRWLRRAWQQAELYRFLSEAANRGIVNSPTEILDRLCRATNQITGSLVSAVALWDETEKCLIVQTSTGIPVDSIDSPAIEAGAIGRVWHERQPAVAHTLASFGSTEAAQLAAEVGASTLLAVPITASQTRGVLLAFLRSTPLFVADDLLLLTLLAEQSAIALDYVTLLAEQKAVSVQLQVSNQELGSFAYSVSHDLRAPLRAIDGFSQALLEDCGEQLGDQGKIYLGRVRSNVQRMGELIDALLTLSQLTRVEMNRESVDLSALVREIADELQKREAQRQVEFVIEDDLLVDGDPSLLQVALENLLDNAWKFSSKRPQARIEFRVMDYEGQTAYFVRDDGAGFDMAYADKLFGAFQRLHSMNDFSGTGIGLATVQRIIHRHGGQLWAEAAPNQGATFYFTL